MDEGAQTVANFLKFYNPSPFCGGKHVCSLPSNIVVIRL